MACASSRTAGVNGIDGFVSTVLGVAAAADDGARRSRCSATSASCTTATGCSVRPTAASTRRSSSSTTAAAASSRSCPQADLPEHFEALFGTPQAVDLAALARVHGIPVTEVDAAERARARARRRRSTAGGVRVVRVRTDRADNVDPPPRGLGRGRRFTARWTFRSSKATDAVNARRAQGRTSARSMGSSFAWVSAHSASGSEPATMPAPATRRARAPSSSAQRSAIAHSPLPRASTQPTGPA